MQWVARLIRFHDRRHPVDLGKRDVEAFLTDLAVDGRVTASTQNQALAAILFFYRHVLELDLPWLDEIAHAKRPRRLPEIMTPDEVARLLSHMTGTPRLMALILYGTGMRLMECACLRVKDVDFATNQILVRSGKGDRDRRAMLPAAAKPDLIAHLNIVRTQYEADIRRGCGYVELPNALERKLPNAAREWRWQWLFPATRQYRDPRTSQVRRHHLHETVLQRAVTNAARAAGFTKRVTCHTFRHSFATNVLEAEHDIRAVQELLGHADVRTTMTYIHILNRTRNPIVSPADRLPPPPPTTPRPPANARIDDEET